jgi:hypothetical protein
MCVAVDSQESVAMHAKRKQPEQSVDCSRVVQ